MVDQPIYSRLVIKLSGEALGEGNGMGVSKKALSYFAKQIQQLAAMKIEVAIVIGGGNFMRGAAFSEQGFNRVTADQMGMLFTVANGLALRSALDEEGVAVALYSAIAIPGIVDIYQRDKAVNSLIEGKIVLFTAGIGAPLFSTDSAAALRAVEINAEVILKASTVDGVYSADPKKNQQANRYQHLTYEEALAKKLRVMDLAALCLCQDHNVAVRVFNMTKQDVLKNIVLGVEEGTLITN